LVQIVLEIVYCPVYKPILLDADEASTEIYEQTMADMPQSKFMSFNSATVTYIEEELLNMIATGDNDSYEVLETSQNQKQLIQ
jgi:hypothetical protein